MLKRGKRLGLGALLALGLLALGCENNTGDVAPLVTPIASVKVDFVPNPPILTSPGKYKFEIFLSETANVGVHIYGVRREVYSDAGQLDESYEYSQQSLELWFELCDGLKGNYVPASSVRCLNTINTVDSLELVKNSGYEIWKFFGVDDSGNEVIGEGRLELN